MESFSHVGGAEVSKRCILCSGSIGPAVDTLTNFPMTIVAGQYIIIVNHLDCIAWFGLEPGIEEGNVGLSNAKSGPGRVQGLGHGRNYSAWGPKWTNHANGLF